VLASESGFSSVRETSWVLAFQTLMKLAAQDICGSKATSQIKEQQVAKKTKKKKDCRASRIHQSRCEGVACALKGEDPSHENCKTYQA